METDDNLALQSLFHILNKNHFKNKLEAVCVWNGRLTRTGARVSKSGNSIYLIEVATKQFEHHGWKKVRRLLLHEMCHLSVGLKRRHDSPWFRAELRRVGAARHSLPLPIQKSRVRTRYLYKCYTCGRTWERKRKYGKPMLCRKCRTRIRLVEAWRI